MTPQERINALAGAINADGTFNWRTDGDEVFGIIDAMVDAAKEAEYHQLIDFVRNGLNYLSMVHNWNVNPHMVNAMITLYMAADDTELARMRAKLHDEMSPASGLPGGTSTQATQAERPI